MNKLTQLMLASVSLVALTTSALADGGNTVFLSGGADSATGTGGTGGSNTIFPGAGGGAGVVGGDGGVADPDGTTPAAGGAGGATPGQAGASGIASSSIGLGDGSGGGGGAHGSVVTGTTNNSSTITGGAGGAGGNGAGNFGYGGGGGAGGWGVVVNGSNLFYTDSGIIAGGAGGAGGSGVDAGSGGSGGIGMFFTGPGSLALNSGSITGGNGGAAGIGLFDNGANGLGGVGVVGAGLNIDSYRSISGGLAGNGVTRADAIDFTGGSNALALESGSGLTGNINVASGASLALTQFGGAQFTAITGGGSVSLASNVNFTAANTYTGTTSASASYLYLSGAGTIANSSELLLSNGSIFDISGISDSGTTVQLLSGNAGTSVYLGSKTLTLGSTASVFAGTINDGGIPGGTGGSLVVNSGTVQLSGANTYTGLTTISGGSLYLVGGGTLASGNNVELDSGNFDVSGTTNQVLGTISGSGGTLFVGENAPTLTVATLSGTHAVVAGEGGTLTVTDYTAAGTLTVDTHGIANVTNLSGNVAVSVASGGLLNFGGATNESFAGNFTGAGTIAKYGTGIQTLTGDNSGFTGGFDIEAGTLQLGSATALNAGNFDNEGILDLNGFSNTGVPSYIHSGGVITNNGAQAATLTILTGEFNGQIQDGTSKTNIVIANNSTASPSFVDFYETVKTYSGTTTILSGGTLQVGEHASIPNSAVIDHGTLDISRNPDPSSTIKSLSGDGKVVVANKTLILNNANDTFSGIIQETGGYNAVTGGGLTLLAGSETLTGANTYTGSTTLSGGTLLVGTATVGTPGAITSSAIGTGTLVLDGGILGATGNYTVANATQITANGGSITTTNGQTITLSGVISGGSPGALTFGGSGTTVLTGANTYTGSTTLSGGTLLVGTATVGTPGAITSSAIGTGTLVLDGGTLGATGNYTVANATQITANGGSITTTNGQTLTLSGVISGGSPGALTVGGNGTTVLTGISTYAGATTVSGGTLMVNGSISQSAATIASGAKLAVTGTAGATTVAAGGTLLGTGTVGATTVASGGTLSPGGSSVGTLAVNGNLTMATGSTYAVDVTAAGVDRVNVSGTATLHGNVVVTGSSFAPGTYTIVNATSGIGNTSFAGLTGVSAFRSSLTYDANDAFLTLTYNALTPLLSSGATPQERNVAAGIDAAINHGASLPSAFNALFSLTGNALNAALDQITGAIGPNIAQAFSHGAFLPFIDLMTSSGMNGSGDQQTAGNFGPGAAYGAVKPAQLVPDKLRLWGQVYGGHTGISANAATGAAGVNADTVGGVVGAESQFNDGTLVGVSAGFGQQDFRSGNGTGHSSNQMIGVYGRTNILGQGYVAAAMGYGWDAVGTLRTVTVSGTDNLAAHFDADEFGGRIEAGYRVSLGDQYVLAPFAAFAGSSFEAPAYAEHAVSGASTFALSYNSQSTAVTRSEVGAHLGGDFALSDGTLSLEGMAAWAHQLNDQPVTTAAFGSLAGSAFTVYGVQPATDSTLLGLSASVRTNSGFGYGVSVNGQFGRGTSVVSGAGTLSYRW